MQPMFLHRIEWDWCRLCCCCRFFFCTKIRVHICRRIKKVITVEMERGKKGDCNSKQYKCCENRDIFFLTVDLLFRHIFTGIATHIRCAPEMLWTCKCTFSMTIAFIWHFEIGLGHFSATLKHLIVDQQLQQ